MSLTTTSFKIFRVRSNHTLTTFELDTFSSTIGEWAESCFISPMPVQIRSITRPALVLNDVLIWRDFNSLVVFDPAKQLIELIHFPEVSSGSIIFGETIGLSEGKIFYARVNVDNSIFELEVWLLEDIQWPVWILKRRVERAEIFQDNPGMIDCPYIMMGTGHFHPHDCRILVLHLAFKPYWYNYVSGRLTEVNSGCSKLGPACFVYEWPCESSP